jgi:hypothetical protein
MGEKLIVGPIDKALRTNRTAFVIDNDNFPVLQNAYQWRGRVKRKRGTVSLTRLGTFFSSGSPSINTGNSIIILANDGSGNGIGNLLTGFTTLPVNATIVPGTASIFDNTTSEAYADNGQGVLVGNMGHFGTINYSSGNILLTGRAGDNINAVFNYYSNLPVMGLEDLTLNYAQNPGLIDFDTTYAYNTRTSSPYLTYSVSFYKNLSTTTYPGYVQKGGITPVWTQTSWNGEDYQQFYSVNYQGALWVTNGVQVPFSITNIGMQYSHVTNVAAPTPTTVDITVTGPNLVVGDFVYLNEFDPAIITGINFQTGYVTAGSAPGVITVTLPFANMAGPGGATTKGIVQYLTNRSDTTKDCLRWYDGDPTVGDGNANFLLGKGWVNFMPPLSQSIFSIADLPAAQYYLVGAKIITAFKDRLLFIGPVIQTSSAGSQVYLPDTVIFSQNGTPYYTCSFAGSNPSLYPLSPTTPNGYVPILVPSNQTATPTAYFEDLSGFGDFITAGINQSINTVSPNRDALIFGFDRSEYQFVYTGNDLAPFNFFLVNSEYGSSSTFSAINFDQGVMTRGDRGYIITSQTNADRVDLDIPDSVFEIALANNGRERFTAIRDYINEWAYFTYNSNIINYTYPNVTLQYNYRDNSWAIFYECYTTYGTIRDGGITWSNVGNVFPTWSQWNQPWNYGSSTALTPKVIGGNQQGFVVFKGEGTGEAPSTYIANISFATAITGATNANPAVLTTTGGFIRGQKISISGVVGMTQLNGNTYTVLSNTATTVTINVDSTLFGVYISGGVATPLEPIYSPNHCLNDGDYIQILSCIGTIAPLVNGQIFQVNMPTTNGFSPLPPLSSGTYLGGGVMVRYYVPFIQTKQFPTAWGLGRKTRIGVQQYLLTTTQQSQIQLLIFLSQDGENAYNLGPIVPSSSSVNNSLIYSTILYTCPESVNIGLTPANINQLMITNIQTGSSTQAQIWHRMNTSLIGDTVQIGFTLSDMQMRTYTSNGITFAITGISQADPCVIQTTANYSIGTLIQIFNVVGMTQINTIDPTTCYYVIASNSSSITINLDSILFSPWQSGGIVTAVTPIFQTAEIELHGFILDVNPSQMLA